MGYEQLKPFLTYWYEQFEPGAVGTPRKLVHSLSVERVSHDELSPEWQRALTGFRRLRDDARLRVAKRFLRSRASGETRSTRETHEMRKLRAYHRAVALIADPRRLKPQQVARLVVDSVIREMRGKQT